LVDDVVVEVGEAIDPKSSVDQRKQPRTTEASEPEKASKHWGWSALLLRHRGPGRTTDADMGKLAEAEGEAVDPSAGPNGLQRLPRSATGADGVLTYPSPCPVTNACPDPTLVWIP
jgi:hypothetical protein